MDDHDHRSPSPVKTPPRTSIDSTTTTNTPNSSLTSPPHPQHSPADLYSNFSSATSTPSYTSNYNNNNNNHSTFYNNPGSSTSFNNNNNAYLATCVNPYMYEEASNPSAAATGYWGPNSMDAATLAAVWGTRYMGEVYGTADYSNMNVMNYRFPYNGSGSGMNMNVHSGNGKSPMRVGNNVWGGTNNMQSGGGYNSNGGGQGSVQVGTGRNRAGSRGGNSNSIQAVKPSKVAWVGNLPDVNDRVVRSFFANHCNIMTLNHIPRSRCAFIQFGTDFEVDNFIAMFDQADFQG
ncbi:hypothetical protein HDU76_012522, partial [Blyttiomyces sp. JEL0837]